MTENAATSAAPRQPPAPDVLVQGPAAAASYGPRVARADGVVEPAWSAASADFWGVYEWRTSKYALEGGWWEWVADCASEATARSLAKAIAYGA